jgi:TRAP-type C4-dicarboxylate transport system substrate-binding protein
MNDPLMTARLNLAIKTIANNSDSSAMLAGYFSAMSKAMFQRMSNEDQEFFLDFMQKDAAQDQK